ncbi:MAG: RNA polymerase sigma factor RpoD/SigA [Oligosphaeraceae bacterium]
MKVPKPSQEDFQDFLWKPWGSQGLMASYMRDVGNFPLLSQEDEAQWAQRYRSARQEVQELLQEHPQVIIQRLRDLRDDPDRKGLSTYLVFTQNFDGQVEEEEDLGGEGVLEALDGNVLNRLLQNPSEVMRKCTAHGAMEGEGGETKRSLAEIIAPYLRTTGNVHFQQRFMEDCVRGFIEGRWTEEGLSEKAKKKLCLRMKDARQREQEAMNALVEGNLRLVISVAKHFSTNLLSFADMVQEGNIGLMRAIESFEWQRGHRLSTYACFRIRHAITMALNAKGRSIRIPMNILRQLSKIRRLEQEFIQQNGVEPNDEELAKVVGISLSRLRALRRMVQQPISLQSITTEDRDWNDVLGSPEDPMREKLNQEAVQDALVTALEALRPNERDVVERHFGLNGRSVQSLETIANHYGLTSERIRQIEVNALAKLRRSFKETYRGEG